VSSIGTPLNALGVPADASRRVRRDAVHAVCALLDDAEAAARVLDILGLDPHEGLELVTVDATSASPV
jgi:hypothetical protein